MKRIVLAYFSPTHTTEKILKAIAEGMNIDNIVDYNLTLPEAEEVEICDGDIVLLGAPVYVGRLPRLARERLSKISGSNQPALCVAVYGNRTYGDAIAELADVARKSNLIPLAGAGFIGEHSYSNEDLKIAHGRPNAEDLSIARDFGIKLMDKLRREVAEGKFIESALPGETPSESAPIIPPMASIPSFGCDRCGICIGVCPSAAINESLMCDPAKCLKCCACVKSCPKGARELLSPVTDEFAKYLSELEPKKPELFYK